MSKIKILTLSDHPLSPSGVGTQTRYVCEALLKTGRYSIISLGGAIKHQNYNPVQVDPYKEDWRVIPVDGYGTQEMIRSILRTEKPDILFIFTDPRFFTWLFEIEDEIRQVCPIVCWHVWDNYPYTEFNRHFYQATDLLNCHSHMTYTMLKDKFPKKTNWIPHSLPKSLFYPLDSSNIKNFKKQK